ncbi:MAG: hypothetical protein WAR41_15075, partial [Azonexus sp.]
FAGGNAEQQAITDLAGGAGNGNAHGCFGHVSLLFETAWLKLLVFARKPAFLITCVSRHERLKMVGVRRFSVNSSCVLYKITFRGRPW